MIDWSENYHRPLRMSVSCGLMKQHFLADGIWQDKDVPEALYTVR